MVNIDHSLEVKVIVIFGFKICIMSRLFRISAIPPRYSAFLHNFAVLREQYYLLPAYAIASRASLLDSATCATELRDFLDAVDQRILWGLRSK